MCGVAGILRIDGTAVDAGPLEGMLDTIVHRGPDDRGTWTEGSLALGHVRLSVIDPSARAHQPMLTADGQGVLAYNGEVYNFPELRAELEAEGVRFESHGDAAVVLEALHRWGPKRAIPRFDGMFAFAYLDRRDQTLWLARDRFGIKSLSIARRDGLVLFSSEIKALFAHPAVRPIRDDLHGLPQAATGDAPLRRRPDPCARHLGAPARRRRGGARVSRDALADRA
jgi:asparagine synthase (glutamine-hydrolysing)